MTGVCLCPGGYSAWPDQLNALDLQPLSGAIWVQFAQKTWNLWR